MYTLYIYTYKVYINKNAQSCNMYISMAHGERGSFMSRYVRTETVRAPLGRPTGMFFDGWLSGDSMGYHGIFSGIYGVYICIYVDLYVWVIFFCV